MRVDAGEGQAEELPSFPPVDLEDEDVLVVAVDVLAWLELALELALSGDTVKAKRACDDLLTLWKNADAKIPMVEQARTECARLP